jgi:hypothetical protein
MPCYRCGARQVDPDRGQSPWKRGVRGDHQVLVCPDCQVVHDWTAELDRCRSCGGTHLVRRLGEVECRACGLVRAAGEQREDPQDPRDPVASPAEGGSVPGLSEEVARALDRVLGRSRAAARGRPLDPAGIGNGDPGSPG